MRLFVTGTDTEVGKSVTTACLAAALAERGPVRALKPVASGVEPGEPGEDAALLGLGAGHAPPQGGVTLRTPCAPARAAREEGVDVRLATVLAWIAENGQPAGATLVEGVGGWEVPIGADWGVPDLAVALGWPVLVVGADRLGCLNHAVLTVKAVRAAGLRVIGVVLTRSAGGWNVEDLRGLLPGVPVVALPTLASLERGALAAAGSALLDALRAP